MNNREWKNWVYKVLKKRMAHERNTKKCFLMLHITNFFRWIQLDWNYVVKGRQVAVTNTLVHILRNFTLNIDISFYDTQKCETTY